MSSGSNSSQSGSGSSSFWGFSTLALLMAGVLSLFGINPSGQKSGGGGAAGVKVAPSGQGAVDGEQGSLANIGQASSLDEVIFAELLPEQPLVPEKNGTSENAQGLRVKVGSVPIEVQRVPAEKQKRPWSCMKCDVNNRLKDMNAELEFLIATLPDPILSHFALFFDEGVEAIVRAFKSEEYVLVRNQNPWSAKNPELAKESPGLLLFRKSSPKRGALSPQKEPTEMKHEYCCVVLVGETPTTGIHNGALRKALEFVVQWQSDVKVKSSTKNIIRIMGPFHSGSVPRLSQFLQSWKHKQSFPEIQIVSGSASATGNAKFFDGNKLVRFRSMAPTEEKMLDLVDKHLSQRGIKRSQIALLTESDTTYGKDIKDKFGKEQSENQEVVVITYPLSLARMRTELERAAIEQGESQVAAEIARHKNVTVKEEVSPSAIDVLPLFSKASTGSSELVLESLIDELRRRDIRAVGLMGTDVNDKLFLARRLRTVFPDIQFFTTRNNLLFTHSDYSAFMRGTIVAGCASLNPAFRESRDKKSNGIQQFSNDSVYGIFWATREFLQGMPVDSFIPLEPWLSMVGDDDIWPLQTEASLASGKGAGEIVASTLSWRLCLPGVLVSAIALFSAWGVWWETNKIEEKCDVSLENEVDPISTASATDFPKPLARMFVNCAIVLSGIQFLGVVLVAAALTLPSIAGFLSSCTNSVRAMAIGVYLVGAIVMCGKNVLRETQSFAWCAGSTLFRMVLVCAVFMYGQYLCRKLSAEDAASIEFLRYRMAFLANRVNPAFPVACLGGVLVVGSLGLRRSIAIARMVQRNDSTLQDDFWGTILKWLGARSSEQRTEPAHCTKNSKNWKDKMREVVLCKWLGAKAVEQRTEPAHCTKNSKNWKDKMWEVVLCKWLGAKAVKQRTESAHSAENSGNGKVNEYGGKWTGIREVIDHRKQRLRWRWDGSESKTGVAVPGLIFLAFGFLCFLTWLQLTWTVEGWWYDMLVWILFLVCGGAVLLVMFVLEGLVRQVGDLSKDLVRTGIVSVFKDVPHPLREKVAKLILCQRADDDEDLESIQKMFDAYEKCTNPAVLAVVVASIVTIRLRELFCHVRNLASVSVISLVLLFAAIVSYPFQTNGMLLLTWGLLFAWGLYIVVEAILRFNQSEALSVLSGTAARLTFDRTLWMPILQYVVMPLVIVVALAVPSIGQWLLSLVTQLTTALRNGPMG